MSRAKATITGSGDISTHLMVKVLTQAKHLEMSVLVGIDPESDGLARARNSGVVTTHDGVEGLRALPEFDEIAIVRINAAMLGPPGKRPIDLPRPRSGGQATMPIVAAAATRSTSTRPSRRRCRPPRRCGRLTP